MEHVKCFHLLTAADELDRLAHYGLDREGSTASGVTIQLGHDDTIAFEAWPTYDEAALVENTVEIGIQVNGKVKGTVEVGVDEDNDSAIAKAKAVPSVQAAIEGKNIVKEIYVKGKIINIVVK